MKATASFLETVGQIVRQLAQLGVQPILVGGMALVVLGSRRVTRDFDFVISLEPNRFDGLFDVFYGAGFELVSKLDSHGHVVRTIDNANIARMRARTDRPLSLFFYNRATGLRIDLLLDFPLPAHELLPRANTVTVQSYKLCIASREDLLRLKEIAYQDRHEGIDLQDIQFLQSLDTAK